MHINHTITKDLLDREMAKIQKSSIINIEFNPKSKEILFLLGAVFAAGKQINITNELELTPTKSFSNMVNHWSKNGLVAKISNESFINKIFLICPVRDANLNQIEKMRSFVNNKAQEGYKVHYPLDHTNQLGDQIGYRICTENANAIGDAKSVSIYYDQASRGTMFDLGVAYYFQYLDPTRTFVLENAEDIVINPSDFGDTVVNIMQQKKLIKTLIKK